jgi:hypothetical protein
MNADADLAAREKLKREREEFKRKIYLFLWLTVSTSLIVFFTDRGIEKLLTVLMRESHVAVSDISTLSLEDAPAAFHYDAARRELVYIGLVDDSTKKALVALARDGAPGSSAAKAAYLAAVEQLAFTSTEVSQSLSVDLLILGGCVGMLGVQLRSIVNFVGHACFRNDLDLKRWWVYYAIRPLTGFLLGIVVVAIVRAGLLPLREEPSAKALWWSAVAFFAGFGEEEFTQRLRLISKTLFGVEHERKPDLSNSVGTQSSPALTASEPSES